MDVDYFREDTPLGTVGALAHIEKSPIEPFVVMNGDVLSDLSFSELLSTHRRSGGELTIASYRRRVRDEFGILETDGGDRLVDYHEKPEHEYLVSMGIYVVAPSVVELIPPGRKMEFPDLVQALLDAGRGVTTHNHAGYWLDLGRPDDYSRANQEFEEIRPRLGI